MIVPPRAKVERRVLGDEHPSTLQTIYSLGKLHVRMGAHASAVRLLEEAVARIALDVTFILTRPCILH